MAPRDQSNSEAPGLPVALSKIAGVTNTPVPSFPFVKVQLPEKIGIVKPRTDRSINHSTDHSPEA